MFKVLKDLFAVLITVIEIGLILRFVLKFLGANTQATMVSWLYVTTEPLLNPFKLAFPTPSVNRGIVLEFTTLFAIFAYAFLGFIVQELLMVLVRREQKTSKEA